MIKWLLERFGAWYDENARGLVGYETFRDGPLYSGGETEAYRGFKQIQEDMHAARPRARYAKDPDNQGLTMEALWAMFRASPAEWSPEKRMFLAASVARYMAELD